jgi:hypothetical protein
LGVGHAAVALAAAKIAPRVNLGWLVFAAFLADFMLGIFAAQGLEQIHVPPDYASRHYLTFTSLSHGLVPLWSGARSWWVRLATQGSGVSRNFSGGLRFGRFALHSRRPVHVAGLPILGESFQARSRLVEEHAARRWR